MKPSIVSKLILDNREFLVKRDELTDIYLSGNKYRKLYTLLKTPKNKYNTIISYGGTQSNAMLSIAALCKGKGWNFKYYTKSLSPIFKEQNHGNYFHAISLGMNHFELKNSLYEEFVSSLRVNLDDKTYILDQGGADKSAKEGLMVLAQEIKEQDLGVKSLATPSGTGTTALYLALALPEYKVYTTPCVGSVSYLREQMLSLTDIPKNLIILKPRKRYHFAKLYPDFLDIYNRLKISGIEFDLLYSPSMWFVLLEQTDEKILYIHSGGLIGNETMLKRYKHKGYFLS